MGSYRHNIVYTLLICSFKDCIRSKFRMPAELSRFPSIGIQIGCVGPDSIKNEISPWS